MRLPQKQAVRFADLLTTLADQHPHSTCQVAEVRYPATFFKPMTRLL
jgi:hypothetical protein